MASILNNIASLKATRNLRLSEIGLNRTINRLSTGERINDAADDAAGLQISSNLRADIRVLNQARRNANDANGRIAIAEGTMEEAVNILTRAAELAEQAASGTTSTAGRTALDQEFQEIKQALNSLHSDTKFDGQQVYSFTFSTRVGETTTEVINITTVGISSESLSVSGNLLTSNAASVALTQVTTAIEQISANRGNLGAKSQRLNTTINSLGISVENIQAAESQIRDADVADEVVNLTKFQILNQTGVSALAQANQSTQSVLSLLQG
ncbi:MAG: flagellin [Acidobacteriota bacterium]|nr:flagellin [Acidobacteriota bacterium]